MIEIVTTCLAPISDDEPVLDGGETYPIYGPSFSKIKDHHLQQAVEEIHSKAPEIQRKMKGLKRHFSCMEKAIILRSHINQGIINIGSLLVWNKEWTGSFGYYYNPPYEFHAWVTVCYSNFIVDFGLPGVIEKGLVTEDEIGPLLMDIQPIIICGLPPQWIKYKSYEHISGDDCKSLAAKYSLDITKND